MTLNSRLAIGESSPVKVRLSFDELHSHPLAGQGPHEPAQIVEVAGETRTRSPSIWLETSG
jgi:hypothetical protein